jgi:hypothetical protein
MQGSKQGKIIHGTGAFFPGYQYPNEMECGHDDTIPFVLQRSLVFGGH